jgi:hypothetical protein
MKLLESDEVLNTLWELVKTCKKSETECSEINWYRRLLWKDYTELSDEPCSPLILGKERRNESKD